MRAEWTQRRNAELLYMPEGDKFEVAVKNGRWVVTRPRPALGHALLQNAIPIRHATSGIPVARGQGTDHEADDGELLRIVAAAGTALIVVALVVMLFMWFGDRHAGDRPHPLNQEKPVPKHHK
jgi:hypothetical protein